VNCGPETSPQLAHFQSGPETRLFNTSCARAASASFTTQSSAWHSAGGNSPIAEESNAFLTTASMPSACSKFLA
jgi:hypothetical protein